MKENMEWLEKKLERYEDLCFDCERKGWHCEILAAEVRCRCRGFLGRSAVRFSERISIAKKNRYAWHVKELRRRLKQLQHRFGSRPPQGIDIVQKVVFSVLEILRYTFLFLLCSDGCMVALMPIGFKLTE